MGEQHPVRAAAGRCALHVEDLAGGLIADGPAPLARPPAKVDVLHVHEVGPVEAAYGVPGLPAGQETGTRDPVDVTTFCMVPVGHRVAPAPRVARPELPDQAVPEGIEQAGEAARRGVEAPIGVVDPRPDEPQLGLLVEAPAQRRHGPGAQHHVGVADQQVGALGCGAVGAQVRGRPIAEVGPRGQPLHLREVARNSLPGTVGGTVVHHYQHVHAVVEEARHAAEEVLLGVVVDDHPGEVAGEPLLVAHVARRRFTVRSNGSW